jgi:hypothetical protein
MRPNNYFFTTFFVIGTITTGCATSGMRSDGNGLENAQTPLELRAQGAAQDEIDRLGNPREIKVGDVVLKNVEFDIPVRVNTLVEQWVDYFTGRGRKHFELYLARSEYFIPYIRPILKNNQMPEDLVYLAMIESGFNNHARSRAKAVGPWQFISATGKRYGLAVNWWVDERRDIEKSTLAAIQYLKELYGIFGTWELAAAAYNAGEAKVGRAVQRYGSRDFWVLSRHRFFRPETRHYVPKMIAAALISKNQTLFGFPERFNKSLDELEGESLAVTTAAVEPQPQPQSTGTVGVEEAEPLVPNPLNTVVEVTNPTPAATLVPRDRVNAIPTPQVSKKGELMGEKLLEFEVASPADLGMIAKASGIDYHAVKSFNPEIRRWCTPPNVATYKIKLPESVREKFLSVYNHPAFPRGIRFRTFEAKAGDSPERIARRFGLHVDPILDLNNLSKGRVLGRPTKVLLPIPSDGHRSFQTLDLTDPPSRRRGRKRFRPKVSQGQESPAAASGRVS